MHAAAAAAELEALGDFYGALAARQYFGDHVCLAAHPADANGSIEDVVDRGVELGAHVTAGWAEKIADAVTDRSSTGSILTALGSLELDLAPFAKVVEEQILHAAMLGVLDSEWERTHDQELEVARFDAAAQALKEGAFSSLPYLEARAAFEKRQVLPRPAFDALEKGAKRQAFTVAGMASEEMLNVTKAELARQLAAARARPVLEPDGVARRPGLNLQDFRKFAKQSLESAGWTPASNSHVETVFRTNAVSALASGRFIEMRKPDVLAALPYWQIRGVNDDRARPTHKAAFGIVLPATDPFWLHAYPPFGYNCRCRVVARTSAWMKREGKKVGPVPKDLPDPGFDSGTHKLISVPPAALEPPKLPVQPHPVKPPVPPWMHPPLTPAVIEPPPLPPPLPPPVPVFEPTVLPPPPPPLELPVVPPAPPTLEPAVYVPPLPPPPPVHVPPPVATAQNILGRKVADATGSNPGGVYEGLDGKKRYVKFYSDPAQAVGEKVANELYGALGFGKLESTTFENAGQLSYASELVPGVKTLEQKGLTPELAKKALEGFAADVLLANWDAAGLTLDNMVVTPRGKVIRIDNGGALLTRAKAGRKPSSALANATEWEKFFSPSVNPGYAKLAQAAGVTNAEELGASLEKGIKKIVAVKKKVGGWGQFVAEHAKGLDHHDQQQMALMLEERTAFLEKKLAAIKKAKKRAKSGLGPVREWSSLPTEPLPAERSAPVPELSKQYYLDATEKRFKEHFDREGRNAVDDFTGAGYGSIRKAARLTEDEWVQANGATGLNEKTSRAKYREMRAKADAIERGFAAAAASAQDSAEAGITEFYRGIGGLSQPMFDKMIQANELVFAAPSSTSWKVDVARRFADNHGGNRVIFVFKPQEQFAERRIAVDAVSSVGQGEAEILARTGSSWRVTKVVKRADDTGGGKCAIVYCEETPKPAGEGVQLRAPGSSMPRSVSQTS